MPRGVKDLYEIATGIIVELGTISIRICHTVHLIEGCLVGQIAGRSCTFRYACEEVALLIINKCGDGTVGIFDSSGQPCIVGLDARGSPQGISGECGSSKFVR